MWSKIDLFEFLNLKGATLDGVIWNQCQNSYVARTLPKYCCTHAGSFKSSVILEDLTLDDIFKSVSFHPLVLILRITSSLVIALTKVNQIMEFVHSLKRMLTCFLSFTWSVCFTSVLLKLSEFLNAVFLQYVSRSYFLCSTNLVILLFLQIVCSNFCLQPNVSFTLRGCSFTTQAAIDLPAGGVIDIPLAQTGEGIAECELLKWFVQEVSGCLL